MDILVLPSCGFRRNYLDAAEECNSSPSFSGRTWYPRAVSNPLRRRSRSSNDKCRRMHFAIFCKANGEGRLDDEEEQEEQDEEKGFWEDEEGKQKLDEIMQMQELVNEAEKLQKAAEASESEEDRARRMQQELARRAKELAERRRIAEKMFKMGQQAYEKGMYDKAVQLLETAVENVSKGSNLGGDIQIWLAMAYEANNQHESCISLYKRLESSHPSKFIQRQAADLRYILEAPKLKISSEERVTIPLINAYSESSQKTWSEMVKERKQNSGKNSIKKPQKDWIEWNPPKWEKNPYFWVAVTLWLTLAGISLMFQD